MVADTRKVFAIPFDYKVSDIVIARSNRMKDLRVYFIVLIFRLLLTSFNKILSGATKMLGFIIGTSHVFVKTNGMKVILAFASELIKLGHYYLRFANTLAIISHLTHF